MKSKDFYYAYIHGKPRRTGWMRAMRVSSEREDIQFKNVRRLHKRYEDTWCFDSSCSKNYRNWKAHSRCSHQWEKHEFPVNERYLPNHLAEDHNREWILECLRQKKTCVFYVHNDDSLYDALESLQEQKYISLRRLENGFFEASLLKPAVSKHPHKKTSPGDKGINGKYRRRKEQHARQIKRQESVAAVAERARRVSRKENSGIALAPLSAELSFLAPKWEYATEHRWENSSTSSLWCKAKADHIKGISRHNTACMTLLANFGHYSDTPVTHRGLMPYEHDYHKYPNALDQCCVWLTGHCRTELPPWVLTFLTDSILSYSIARRVFNWIFGLDSPRNCYGLSKNEAREFVHLPATIENEQQAIVAAIARVHRCDDIFAANLVGQIPNFYNVLDNRNREITRKIIEWLVTLPVPPAEERLHDLLDFFSHSGLLGNPFFSFKGRTLQSVERLMQEWHVRQQMERDRASKAALEAKWLCRGYNYTYKDTHNFRELNSPLELLREGAAQHNCVFSYRHACISGRTSIVSMRGIYSNERLTIEIDNHSRRIVQIREVCNRLPSKEEMRIIRAFASVKNLIVDC